MTKTVSIYKADDWSGTYLNGKLIDEGHSVNLNDLMEKLSSEFGFEYKTDYESSDLDEFGNCMPENEIDIKRHFEKLYSSK